MYNNETAKIDRYTIYNKNKHRNSHVTQTTSTLLLELMVFQLIDTKRAAGTRQDVLFHSLHLLQYSRDFHLTHHIARMPKKDNRTNRLRKHIRIIVLGPHKVNHYTTILNTLIDILILG